MGKVRILFTIPNFTTAGSGREMFNIIERLDKTMFEPFITVNQAGGILYDEILKKGYPIIVEKFCIDEQKSTLNKIVSALQLASKFKKYHFDIWQSFNWSSDYTEALVARFSGAKYVYVKKNMNWDRLAWKLKSRLSTAIIARNTTLLEGPFGTRHFREKTFFVPGGISAEFGIKSESDLRPQLNIPATATLISCVAQLVRTKDQATLIKAVSHFDNVYLVLAGADRDVEYANELKALIVEMGLKERVFLIGSVRNVKPLLHTSDIFVLPTTDKGGHQEGCPVALLEAMSAGIPCIASNVAGNRDLVKPHESGLLFKPGCEEDLANCIQYYLTNPAKARTFASAASEIVKKHYTLEMEAERFSAMYKKLSNL